jgi:hypothetical protein
LNFGSASPLRPSKKCKLPHRSYVKANIMNSTLTSRQDFKTCFLGQYGEANTSYICTLWFRYQHDITYICMYEEYVRENDHVMNE